MPGTAKLERLKQLLNIANDGLSEAKFLEYFKAVLAQISRLEEALLKKIDNTLDKKSQAFNEQIINLLSESKMSFQKMYESHEKAMESMKTDMSKVVKNMVSEHEKKMRMMDEKMMEMHDGKDADEEIIVSKVIDRIKFPEPDKVILPTPNETAKGLNTLEEVIEQDVIIGLKKEIKLLKEMISRIPRGGRVFGGKQLRMDDFSFSGDGSTTAFVLPKEPSAKGKAIWAYLNGQQIQLGVHFTLAGKTMNTTFTPAVGDTIEGYIILY